MGDRFNIIDFFDLWLFDLLGAPSLWFFALQATHNWKLLTVPNFLLRMPLWKKIEKNKFNLRALLRHPVPFFSYFFALIKEFLQTLVEMILVIINLDL